MFAFCYNYENNLIAPLSARETGPFLFRYGPATVARTNANYVTGYSGKARK